MLSIILNQLNSSIHQANLPDHYVVVALSYRGYWTSNGRPSQKGIERDAAAVLDWVSDRVSYDEHPIKVILWGQSIGANIAAAAAARYLSKSHDHSLSKKRLQVQKILLETPFLSIREMLSSIYPQRWLPYRHLWPFLVNHWDINKALRSITSVPEVERPQVLILQAGIEELLPHDHGSRLEKFLVESGFEVQRMVVFGALHTEIMSREVGRRNIVEFIKEARTVK